MDNDELRTELERIYTTVRQAFAEYNLDAARPYLTLPPGTPEPPREQAAAMADFMPDMAAGQFIELRTKGDVAAYYMQPDARLAAVAAIRYTRKPDGSWVLAPAPHTMSAYETDEVKPADAASLIDLHDSLAVTPEGMGPEGME